MTEKLNIASYNCHGAVSSLPEIRELCEISHIVCIQKHWLYGEDLKNFHSMHKDYTGTGVSPINPDSGILKGRPFGEVSIMWRKSLDSMITVLDCGDKCKWMCGICVGDDDRKCIILSVYLPYQNVDNVDDFICCLSDIEVLVDSCTSTSVFIMGDYNCDLKSNGIFSQHFKRFINDNSFIGADYELMKDAFTFMSDAWGTCSWLDHCICTADAYTGIQSIDVLYEYVTSDHKPLYVCTIMSNLPLLHQNQNDPNIVKCNIKWERLSKDILATYTAMCTKKLSPICVSSEAYICAKTACMNEEHTKCVNELHENIVECLSSSSSTLVEKHSKPQYKLVPGWNECVRQAHQAARDSFLLWMKSGKPKEGLIYTQMKNSRSLFKYSLRHCKILENQKRADSMASKLAEKDCIGFWNDNKTRFKKSSFIPYHCATCCRTSACDTLA